MKKGWTTTKLIAGGGISALLVVFSLFGAALTSVTGVVMVSGTINVFVSGMIFALVCLLLKQFGAATLTGFVFSVLAIPLPLFGAAGFFPKVFSGILIGLAGDFAYTLLRRNERMAALAVGAATQVSVLFVIVGLGYLLRMPGIEKAAELFFSPLGVFGAILGGGIGGYLGWLIYSRIEDTAVVKRIQA